MVKELIFLKTSKNMEEKSAVLQQKRTALQNVLVFNREKSISGIC